MNPNLTCGRIGSAMEQVRNVIRARITLIVNKLTSKCKQFKVNPDCEKKIENIVKMWTQKVFQNSKNDSNHNPKLSTD